MNECGACQACCTVLSVGSLRKPTYTVCSHQCAAGCDIYAERPQTCRDYICTWREGVIPGDDARPDRLGVIFDVDVLTGTPSLNLYEVWAGAFQQNEARIVAIKDGLKARFHFGRVVWIPYGTLVDASVDDAIKVMRPSSLTPVGPREFRYTLPIVK